MDDSIVIIITLVSCAFFSGLEIAFLTSNKLQIELDAKQEKFTAKIYSQFVKQPSRFISTTLLGNSIAIVIYGLYSEEMLEPAIALYTHSHVLILLLKTLLSTVFILLVAEYIPKALFSINPNRSLNLFALPFIIVYFLLYPFVWFTMKLYEGILKLFGSSHHEHKGMQFKRIDLDNYVNSFSTDYKDKEKMDHEIEIFQNALEFSEVKIRECMIPRTEIVSVEVDEPISVLKNKFIETGLSKLLIYRDSIDNVIGYVHTHEMFHFPQSIKSVLLPISVFAESVPAQEVLDSFLRERRTVGLIIDEYGGTAGMVTLEDVMEEIFGAIDDEHDQDDLTERKIDEDNYTFSGRLEVDYINNKYNLNLPISEEYETLAGLIIKYSENIPHKGEEVMLEPNFKFKMLSVTKMRIDMVHLTLVRDEN